MAVFLENICKFDKCGKIFPTLSHLIIHIEDTHINYDALPPKTNVEASQNYVPLSYILKYQSTANIHTVNEIKEETALMVKQSAARFNSNRTRIPMQNYAQNQYCFTENELCESESSSDSITVDESTTTTSPPNKPKSKKRSSKDPKDKPFACTVPGCHKRYKNINGIKYHVKNGHKNTNQPLKQYKCLCGRSFKSVQKLNVHSVVCVEKHFRADMQKQRRLGPYNEMGYYTENNFCYGVSNAGGNGDNVVVESNEAHLYEVPPFGDYGVGEFDSTFTPYSNIYATPKKSLF